MIQKTGKHSGHPGGIQIFTLWEPREPTKYFAFDSVIHALANHCYHSILNHSINYLLLFIISEPPEPAISVSPSALTLLFCLSTLAYHSLLRFWWLTHNIHKYFLFYIAMIFSNSYLLIGSLFSSILNLIQLPKLRV